MMKLAVSICIFLSLCSCIPSTFDVRIQPSSLYTQHTASSQPLCQAYRWSQRLSQIVANSFSVVQKKAIKLSGRQIVECLGQSSNDICADTTLDNIQKGIQYVNKFGITQEWCYSNKYLQLPGKVCKRQCDNGEAFPRHVKPQIKQEDGIDYIVNKIGKGTFSAFAIVGMYDQMKYYSSENQQYLQPSGDFYGYTIGQIVGWKKGGQTITISLGAQGWGFKGYANLPKNSKIIKKVYSVYYDQNKPRSPNKIPLQIRQK